MTPFTPTRPLTGAELQTLREACNLTREELGELAGVAARTIKHWESGRAGVPADVAALAQRLDATIQQAADQGARAVAQTSAAPRRHRARRRGSDPLPQRRPPWRATGPTWPGGRPAFRAPSCSAWRRPAPAWPAGARGLDAARRLRGLAHRPRHARP